MNEKKSKFEFWEIVFIRTADPEKTQINGKKGYVLGKAYDYAEDGTINWYYDVHFFDCVEGWGVDENELFSSGEFVPKGYGRSNTSIAVSQKGELLE